MSHKYYVNDEIQLRNKFLILLKLVHPDTGEEILEPNKCGELLHKGPRFTVRKFVSVIIV